MRKRTGCHNLAGKQQGTRSDAWTAGTFPAVERFHSRFVTTPLHGSEDGQEGRQYRSQDEDADGNILA